MSKSELKRVRLNIRAPDQSTRIRVLDGALRDVALDANLGEVSVELPPGVYAVQFQLGTEVATETAVLTPGASDVSVHLHDSDSPRFAAAAPVAGTSTIQKSHARVAARISQSEPKPLNQAGAGAGRLMIFARDLDRDVMVNPAQGLTLHDLGGKKLCDVSDEGQHNLREGWSGIHVALPDGAYRLRLSFGDSDFVERIVHVLRDWQTQVFLLVSIYRTKTKQLRPEVIQMSLLMARPDGGFDPERHDMTWTESALQALQDGNNIQGSGTNDMLWAKYQNPMLGIYGGLLHLRRRKINADLMRRVCHNLMGLVGPLPDVLAIGWALAARDRSIRNDKAFMAEITQPQALRIPPMLQESWSHLSLASATHPKLIPADSFMARVAANLIASRPWIAWRGEPPAALVPTASDLQQVGGIKTGFLQTLMEFFSTPALGILLPMAKQALKTPDAGYRLYAPEFNSLERQIAHYIDPMIDPIVSDMVKDLPALKQQVESQLKARQSSKKIAAMVDALRMPTPSVLAGTWGLVRKLYLQALPPNAQYLQLFVTEESFKVKALADLLKSLQKVQTSIAHKRSSRPLTQLQLLYLRYRGRPSTRRDHAPRVKDLVILLSEADYEDATTAGALTTRSISREMQSITASLQVDAATRSFGSARLVDDWLAHFPCLPKNYKFGRLFRTAFVEDTLPTEKTLIPSNLQLLRGVGPKTEIKLHELGFQSLEDIAAKSPAQLRSELAAESRVLGQFKRYQWDKQAKRMLGATSRITST